MSDNALPIAYEKSLDNRFLTNGLRESLEAFQRWKTQTHEYNAGYCASPLLNLFHAIGVPFTEHLRTDLQGSGRKSIYLIEILGSNPTWLSEKNYNKFSPWPSISEDTKQAFREGHSLLLISHLKKQSDSLWGDPVTFEVFKKLHQALDDFNIPADAVIYLGASAEMNRLYQDFVKENKISIPLKAVTHINYFEKGWQTYFQHYLNSGEIFDCESAKQAKNRLRPHKHLCFNREPRWHRKLNLMWLQRQGLLSQGLVSFYPEEDMLRFDRKHVIPEDAEFKALVDGFADFSSKLPLTVDAEGPFHISYCRRWPFADSYFSIITERVFDCQNNWTLLTSKLFKSICNMHPFVVIGQHGYLQALRECGYKSFHPFIDESYDDIADPVLRTKAVWKEIERICAMSLPELHDWYYSLFPILEHNWNHFMTRAKSSEFDQFIADLKSFL